MKPKNKVSICVVSNEKLGLYQVNAKINGKDFSYDREAMVLEDALTCAEVLRRELSKEWGCELPCSVIHIDSGAVEKNKRLDITTARALKENWIASSLHERDYRTEVIDGEEEMLFYARGVFKLSFFTLRDEPKGTRSAQISGRFMDEIYMTCAMRRYGGTWKDIKKEVESMDKDEGTAWIENVYGKYVFQDDVFDALNRAKM